MQKQSTAADPQQVVKQYLKRLESELKRATGVAPEEALSDAREFLHSELTSLTPQLDELDDETIYQRFVDRFGAPADVAAAYHESAEPVKDRGGYAPGWRICCPKCGRSAPAGKAGLIRIGARSWHKTILGFCSQCRRLRWLRVIRDMERANLTCALGERATPDELSHRMHPPWLIATLACALLAFAIWWLIGWVAFADKVSGNSTAEAFHERLPKGWSIVRVDEVPAAQLSAFAKRLGGRIDRLTNTHLLVNSKRLQINVVTCSTGNDADAVYQSMAKIHRLPQAIYRDDKRVVEFVCRDVQLVLDARNRLFLPRTVRYQVSFDAAPLETCDYMSFNRLYNLFLSRESGNRDDADEAIAAITDRFQFSKQLQLRRYGLGNHENKYRLSPAAEKTELQNDGELQLFTLAELHRKSGFPSVSIVADVTAQTYGTVKSKRDPDLLLRANRFWPSDQPSIRKLAAEITNGRNTERERVQAILDWLMPGRNVRYAGNVTGSRYGVSKVLSQRFGHCWDFSDCFVTLCRASGIPCRQVAGWLNNQSGHVWAEALFDGAWHQFDPTAGMGCGSDYIPYLTSEDGELPLVYLSTVSIEVLSTEE